MGIFGLFGNSKKANEIISKISTQQDQISGLLDDIKKVTTEQKEMMNKQQELRDKKYEYVIKSLDLYLPDLKVLLRTREEYKAIFRDTVNTEYLKKLGPNLWFIESDVNHLEFLLLTHFEVLILAQFEQWRIVFDLLKGFLQTEKEGNTQPIDLKPIMDELDKLEKLTTKLQTG